MPSLISQITGSKPFVAFLCQCKSGSGDHAENCPGSTIPSHAESALMRQELVDTSGKCQYWISSVKLNSIFGYPTEERQWEWIDDSYKRCTIDAEIVHIAGCIHEHMKYPRLCAEHKDMYANSNCGHCLLGEKDHPCNVIIWKTIPIGEWREPDNEPPMRRMRH